VTSTLSATLEPTPQKFKGLESFLLSNVDQTITASLQRATVNQAFIEAYKPMVDHLAAAEKLLSKSDLNEADWKKVFPQLPTGTITVSLKYAGDSTSGEVLSDSTSKGFLFVPLDVVRNGPGYVPDNNKSQADILEDLNRLVRNDSQVTHDIIMSRIVATDIQALLQAPLVESTRQVDAVAPLPSQAYIVTGTGMNRIFSNAIPDPDAANSFYATQFGHATYFPGRPYFQGALRANTKALAELEPHTSKSFAVDGGVGEYFYVSSPYMDLGGNGLVITISRKLPLYTETPAVLCLDFKLVGRNDLGSLLRTMIRSFDAPTVTASFDITTNHFVDPNSVHPEDAKGGSPTNEQSDLLNHETSFIQKNSVQLSDILGNIQRIDNKDASGPIEVSVPLGASSKSVTIRQARFLLFSLDPAGYRKITELIGFGGCTGVALFSVLLIAATVSAANRNTDLAKANSELQEAFQRLGAVLWDAPVPYAWLRSDDSIKDLNKAMAEFIGKDHSALKGVKFKELVADEDQKIYDKIEAKRLNGKSVDPYQLHFVQAEGDSKVAWVASAAVPKFDESAGSEIPETFGVLLIKRPEARLELVTEHSAQAGSRRVQG